MELSLAYVDSFEKLRATLKAVGVPVTRDKAEKGTDYPYIVIQMLVKVKKWHRLKCIDECPTIKSLFIQQVQKRFDGFRKCVGKRWYSLC